MKRIFILIHFLTLICLFGCGQTDKKGFFSNEIKQQSTAVEFYETIFDKDFEEAYGYMDESYKKINSLNEFEEDMDYLLGMAKKYGSNLILSNTNKYFQEKKGGGLNIFSIIQMAIDHKNEDSKFPLYIDFHFNVESNKLIHVIFNFTDLTEKQKVPLKMQKCMGEINLSYFDIWKIKNDSVIINCNSLAIFSDNQAVHIVKVVYDMDNSITESQVEEFGLPIAKYAYENGFYEKAKITSQVEGKQLYDNIAITLCRLSDGSMFTKYFNIEKLKTEHNN